MKKIFLLLIILNLNIFANISQKQLDEYLKVSRGGVILNFYQKRLSLILSEKLNLLRFRQDILDISEQEKFVKIYSEEFMLLDKNVYNEIMQFYETEIGNKSIDLNLSTNYNKLEIEDMRKKCKDILNEDCFKYINVNNFDSLSKSKKTLLEQIAKEYDIVKIKRTLMRISLIAMNAVYQKKYQYSDEFIQKYSTYNNPNYKDITKNMTYLYFKHFTEDELTQILKYAKSEVGKQEYQLIEQGIVKYTNNFLGIIIRNFQASRCIVK